MSENKIPALNEEQRQSAYSTENTVTAAGAGSGKTMVLASRYAWLVTEKKLRVSEILTLTYTRKAASQMYGRIHFLLKEISINGLGEQKKLANFALEEFSKARIQTLDSYCSSIVKLGSNRYGLSPDFTIDEEKCKTLSEEAALPFLISNRNHKAIKKLYSEKSPLGIADNIFASALFKFTRVDTWPDAKKSFNTQADLIIREWEKTGKIIREKLSELEEVYTGNKEFHEGIEPLLNKYKTEKIEIPDAEEMTAFFDELNELNELIEKNDIDKIEWAEKHPLAERIFRILELISLFGSLNLRYGKPRDNPAKRILVFFREIFGEFSSLGIFCIQSGLILSVLELISDLQKDYHNKKRKLGIMSFGDISRLARKILIEHHDIRQNEKESFKEIMIDEFQDNNELQKDILFLIAEKEDKNNNSVPLPEDLSPGKLFFVGDEKQSIYRFRGADVSVFQKLKTELKSRDLPLRTNYRSSPLLIGAFNAIFGGSVFDPEGLSPPGINASVFASVQPGSLLPVYEASFTPLRAHKSSEFSIGKFTLCIHDNSEAEETYEEDDPDESPGSSTLSEIYVSSPVENEARFVAEKISSLLEERNEDGLPKYLPHDIAILFRSRTNQHIFEKHLMQLNIPYTSENVNGFFYGGPVNDLMSVLRLSVYPQDRASYAEMLRSPFTGLGLSALALCMLYDTFSDEPLDKLSDADREKYLKGRIIYNKIKEMASNKKICTLLNELWYNQGYRYETLWNSETVSYTELFDYLYHLAARADEENQSLCSFTDYILNLSKSGDALSDIQIPMERNSAVHLTTIHKSKGLEFPVVFLCCCDRRGKNDSGNDILETEESGLAFKPPLPQNIDRLKNIKSSYFWEKSYNTERGKRIAELRRLLYVGMTRAENELYLSGCLNISGTLEKNEKDKIWQEENFSLQLKKYIDLKKSKAKKITEIPGDTILGGSTFFGLCLSAIGANIQEDSENDSSFLTIEKIPLYREEESISSKKQIKEISNDNNGLNLFLEKAEPFYSGKIIETPVLKKNRFSPTYLSKNANIFLSSEHYPVNREFSGPTSSDLFKKVDKIIKKYETAGNMEENIDASGKSGFTPASFGTIAHICTEALMNEREAILPPDLEALLTLIEANTILNEGLKLAESFLSSPLGIKAKNSQLRKSEFPFRSMYLNPKKEEFFINGIIDLVFMDGEEIHIVDFKTDSQENPAQHIPQMACYYRAVSDLFNAPAYRIWLYYLRTGHAYDMTSASEKYSLQDAFQTE